MKNILLLTFSLLIMLSAHASVKDSVGVEKKGSKYFVKHQMETGETLYALSRKYKVTVPEIKSANPGVNISDIGIGEFILVPLKDYKPATTASSGNSASGGNKHKVAPKETLYALSRKYDVSVDALKKANPEIAEKGLQIGMELTIPGKGAAPESAPKAVASSPEPKPEPKPQPKPEPKPTAKPEPKPSSATAAAKPETQSSSVSKATVATVEEPKPRKARAPKELPEDNEKIEKIKESGVAEKAPQKSDAPDFYAFHGTAPVGTIILVVNEENNQNAYVRVIGSLQNPSSETTLVQLSPKAMTRINADGKAKVQLSYFMP